MRKQSVVLLFPFSLLFLTCLLCATAKADTNTRMVNYVLGTLDHNYFLLMPHNLSTYEYLNHYPFSAFMFLRFYDREKITNLTVKELKSGSLGGYDSCCAGIEYFDVLKFDKIKGFGPLAKELDTLDEFGIAEKKDSLISALLKCFTHYEGDLQKYLQGENGVHVFRKGEFGFFVETQLKEYNGNVRINERRSPFDCYEEINISEYDFDKKRIKIDTLSPYSKRGAGGWEYHYVKRFKEKYRDMKYRDNTRLYHRDFPLEIDAPMGIDDAKKLFGDKDSAYAETLLTVVPGRGYFGYAGAHFFVMTSEFKIVRITKNFYKKKNWSDKELKFKGPPIVTVELPSNEEHPFY